MLAMPAQFSPALSGALVVGVFGGAGLVLTQVYSRRGPLIYPVYAGILGALALLLVRFDALSFGARLLVAFSSMFVATLISLIAVLVIGGRQRRKLRESGRPMNPGGAPVWGLPLVLFLLFAGSAGVAHISSVAAVTPAQSRPVPAAAVSSDDAMIRVARDRSNQAIAVHDTEALASGWLPEFTLVSSTNAQSIGRNAARARFAQLFTSRPDVVYVRSPDSVQVNLSWGQAAESGRWTGTWTQADGVTRVGGPYFAKWRKVEGRWLLLTEVFVQTSCSGSSYCTVPP